jgi:hypothetical protein
MKPSPLQLKWINYPAASYEISDDFEGPHVDHVSVADVDAEVKYNENGHHYAYIKIDGRNGLQPAPPYRFSLTAVAGFTFDLEIAKQEYKAPPAALAQIIAVNVARILYAGAREQLAMMTARATYGSTMLESMMLEPKDVRVHSDESVETIMRNVFQVPEEDLAAIKARITESENRSSGRKGKAKKVKADS